MTRQRRDAAATTVSKTELQPVRPMARRYTELFPKEAACHPASPAISFGSISVARGNSTNRLREEFRDQYTRACAYARVLVRQFS